MNTKQLIFLFVLIFSFITQAQVKSPEAFLGYAIGEQFSRHADVVDYFNHVANESPMVSYTTYGKTNERRPLTYAIVTSAENMSSIETLRLEHLKQTGIIPGTSNSNKAVVWLSYNVHGNEASSTEAAMQTLYELITTKKEWLQNTIVIIDPCVNPDGRDRYANWYNQVKANPYNTAQNATEHHEPWPGGRPNHYLFDLNRDWAWATQVETQQRLEVYNKWLPHIHVDFHEQGINDPYYFAPAAEPFHEVITDFQRDFQTEIGKNHAKYFDEKGWLYFTKERFDLLYPSYGDTYPTFMGAIGMTYEQAGHGRAGLGIETDEGYILTLKDRVAHHTTTGLSTIEVATKNVAPLNSAFKAFFKNDGLTYKSYVMSGDPDKISAVTKLLDQHEITYGYTNDTRVSGYHYNSATTKKIDVNTNSLVIPSKQPKGKMVKVLFEPKAALADSLTYDITAWSLPYAYGLDAIASENEIAYNNKTLNNYSSITLNNNAAGYLLHWKSMADAAFLADLLKHNINVRFTEKPFNNNSQRFERGSLIISKSDNLNTENFVTTLERLANKHQQNLISTNTSFATSGPDFGSPDIKRVNKQTIAVLTGEHTSSLSYGEIWHFFETQLNYPITSINTSYFKNVNLRDYDVLILPNGYYNTYIDEDMLGKLKRFAKAGGKVIAIGNAVSTFAGQDGFDLEKKETTPNDEDSVENANDLKKLSAYANREREYTNQLITGSIFKTTLDTTHPMAFGYNDTYFSLKLGSSSYSFLDTGYNIGYIQGEAKTMSGFAGQDALNQQANTMIFGEERLGSGSFIYFVDNPLFRSFWENGKLFLVNSIFFVNNNKVRI